MPLSNKLLIAVAVLLGALVLWQRHATERDFQSWPTVKAHLISAEVARNANPMRRRYFIVQTSYDFVVDGHLYTSNLSRIGERRYDTDTEALQALAELTSREILKVHYDPSNPERNALAR